MNTLNPSASQLNSRRKTRPCSRKNGSKRKNKLLWSSRIKARQRKTLVNWDYLITIQIDTPKVENNNYIMS